MPVIKVVRVFPYRSARVENRVLTMPREFMNFLEDYCARELGIIKDNHTAYQLVCEFDTIYVMFHDAYVWFGTSIVEEDW